jgi:hypothetical protein
MVATRKILPFWWLPASLLVAILLNVVACRWGETPTTVQGEPDPPGSPPLGPPLFQDMTAHSGIDHTYRNGFEANHYAILESLGGGVALIDYDGDGLLDIFVTGGGYFDGPDKKEIKGYPCKLYKNLGNWKFKDVTAEVGLDQVLFYSHGAAVADYDRDGWPDLLVTGYGRLALYHNVADPKAPGGRRFVEVTKEAGLLGEHFWSTSAAFADFDGDGYPDLYVCQYVNWSWTNNPTCKGYHPSVPRDVCPPKQFQSRPHALYRNDGKGHFVDVTKEAGIRVDRDEKDYGQGKGLGVVVVDVNGDGRPDIYVANDTSGNFLYINRSTPGHFRFDEVGTQWGVAVDDHTTATGSMGADAGDFNGTGWPSLWVTNYENENHGLYRNDGHKSGQRDQVVFQFATQEAGIARFGQPYVGFGTGFLDLENRGWEDLFISNGHVIRYPKPTGVQQPPMLLRNDAGPEGRRFNDISARGGSYFQAKHCGRGIAIGDLDNDGLPDVVISHLNEPVAVLRNVSPAGNHWLGVELMGHDRRDVVGAKLTLEVGDRKLTRFAKGGCSYLSSNDRRQLFGLGSVEKVGRLTVDWPSGEPRSQHWDNLPIDRYWRLVQGEATPQAPPGPKKAAAPDKEPARKLGTVP